MAGVWVARRLMRLPAIRNAKAQEAALSPVASLQMMETDHQLPACLRYVPLPVTNTPSSQTESGARKAVCRRGDQFFNGGATGVAYQLSPRLHQPHSVPTRRKMPTDPLR